jgi:hypothetical protein
VWARDLGDDEDRKLAQYYRDRTLLLLEPDSRPPRLEPWEPAPPPAPPDKQPDKKDENKSAKHPIFELEQVR